MIKIKLDGSRAECEAMAERIGNAAKIRKGPKFYADQPGKDKGWVYLEAEIEGAAQSKEEAERERAEEVRARVRSFVDCMEITNVPLSFMAKELMQYFTLFGIFGILNGNAKYAEEVIFARTAKASVKENPPEAQA